MAAQGHGGEEFPWYLKAFIGIALLVIAFIVVVDVLQILATF